MPMWILWFAVILPHIVNGQSESCVVGSVGVVEVTQVTAFTATVEWGRQALPNCSVPYTVCWSLQLSTVTRCLDETTNQTSAMVEGLVPCNNYTIQVSAVDGDTNLTEQGETTARTVPRSVFFMNVTEVGPGQARVFWVFLFVGNECGDQFLVTWQDQAGVYSGSGYAPITSYEYTASGLASCTNYTFSIATLDEEQRPALPLSHDLTTDMLSGVLGVNTVDVSTGVFDMVWTRPADSPGSACTHWFQPCWSGVGDNQPQECVQLDRDTTTTRVTGREPCREYNVSVATVSERSSHTPFWLIHVTPSHNDTVIREVHVVGQTGESAYLHWVPLYEDLPCAMAYRLCWRVSAEDTLSCVLLHTDVTTHNITGLQPRTTYAVDLAALFDTEDESQSYSLSVTTDGTSGAGATAEKISLAVVVISLASFLVRNSDAY